jgi:hypothetical protein
MTCYDCENNRRVYLRDCIGCAVRLVKSARPSRKQQECMIAYLVRNGRFTKDQIIEAIKNDSITADA